MTTANDWLRSNLSDRLLDPTVDFNVRYQPYSYIPLDFDLACYIVNHDIANRYSKIYVPLSGGMDSEFTFLQLLPYGAIPIIVSTPANFYESSYAFHLCRKLNVEPVVLEYKEEEIFRIFLSDIYKPLNSMGYNSVPCLIATRYAVDNGGVAVIGEHAYDCLSEWDFYNDVLVGKGSSPYYFMWTPQIVNAMKEAYNNEDHQEFKHIIYKISYRPKFKYEYSKNFQTMINNLAKTRPFRPKDQTKICVRSQSRT